MTVAVGVFGIILEEQLSTIDVFGIFLEEQLSTDKTRLTWNFDKTHMELWDTSWPSPFLDP